MRASGSWLAALVLAAGLCFAPTAGAAEQPVVAGNEKAVTAEPPKFENEVCLGCHGNEGFSTQNADGKTRSLHVVADRFAKSVHGKRQCVECHKDITEIPHPVGVRHKVSCVECHEALWEKAEAEGKTAENARLGVVVQQIARYMKSIHARPNREDQSLTNATCYNCHDAHYIYPGGSPERAAWRMTTPEICGKCHAAEYAQYSTSVHGREVQEKHNPAAAVCSDCHTTHDVENPAIPATRLIITRNCGNCHTQSFESYSATYHGQVNKLGYAHTAKCFDCHGNHAIQRVSDKRSSVHPENRLKTCQKCHTNATKGFVTFEPHGTTHDFARYPQIWTASKFMIGLLGGTFAFFWTHTGLWFYREAKERKEGKTRTHVRTEELLGKGKQFRRFSIGWRIAHLCFALSLMVLVLTGMTLFYANTAWAPVVAKAFGGPQVTGIVHRTAAVIFATIFLAHLIYIGRRIARDWRTFRWFGPNSMIPNWQDMKDIVAMFKWFVGLGTRPTFDRWTYWEKFDYWAPFWGVTIIGVSGAMLWFPTVTAAFLPGWSLNVATIFHGEEALLAALFLFTVHFFNNHFRPNKFPLDIVMFTGSMPIEEFRREHAKEYQRLVDTKQLDKYLVDVPSKPMTLGSRILGFTLIGVGVTLLVLVCIGFIGELLR